MRTDLKSRPAGVEMPVPAPAPPQPQPSRVPPKAPAVLPPYVEPPKTVAKTELTTFVIVAQDNAELSIRKAHVALASANLNFEVLLVDDASEDHLPVLAKKITDPRFLYLRRPWRSGLEAAKQLGEMQASGRVVHL